MLDLLAAPVFCLLLSIVPIQDCDPRAQYYAPAAQQIPTQHLRMIASISLWDQPNGDAGWPSRTIRLPATNHWDSQVLPHEVGHVVAFTLRLNGPFEDKFWPHDRPLGRTTEYGRTSPKEDLAESYAALVTGSLEACAAVGADRLAWIASHTGVPNGCGRG